jgi:tetratricopeptide (TPR) repeat protein
MVKKRLFGIIVSIVMLVAFTGCSGGGVNGGGTAPKPSTDVNAVIRGNSDLEVGWEYLSKGLYDSAITSFNKVLDKSPTSQEKAEANNGIGWAKSFAGRLRDGMKWFILAKELSNDAKVGLAAAYFQQASKTDMEEVVELLMVELGKNNPTFEYKAARPVGVTNAEVHAMLAYAYAVLENDESAHLQLELAKELDPNYDKTTVGQILAGVEFLLN